MNELFKDKDFNEDISTWDVSSVRNMRSMFNNANSFNQDISYWDVSAVQDIGFMFAGTDSFNQDIGNWDVSGATDMREYFIKLKDLTKI